MCVVCSRKSRNEKIFMFRNLARFLITPKITPSVTPEYALTTHGFRTGLEMSLILV